MVEVVGSSEITYESVGQSPLLVSIPFHDVQKGAEMPPRHPPAGPSALGPGTLSSISTKDSIISVSLSILTKNLGRRKKWLAVVEFVHGG